MIKIFMGKHSFYHRQTKIVRWCTEYFGEQFTFRWGYDITFGNGVFYFENTNDAMLFKLRWMGTDEN